MKKISKTFFFTAIVFFISITLGSCMWYIGSFKYNTHVENPADTSKNFLVKTDSTRIYGDEITWKSSSFTNGTIKIDGQQFRMRDVRGYMKKGIYYGRFGGEYLQRILHGKINIYMMLTLVSATSDFTTSYYYQRGEDGEMLKFKQDHIIDIVKDCPQAVKMASVTEQHKNKKDPNYLSSIFDVYNNCKN